MQRIRILLVDDDTALANLLEKYLIRMGFEVESLTDARRALELFRTAATRFQLVVADMTMPGLSGEELIRHVFQLDPEVRAILCSGYPAAGAALDREFRGRVQFLQKPFISRMLADTIQKLLDLRDGEGSHPASSRAS